LQLSLVGIVVGHFFIVDVAVVATSGADGAGAVDLL
jgi:hypothetical protein